MKEIIVIGTLFFACSCHYIEEHPEVIEEVAKDTEEVVEEIATDIVRAEIESKMGQL
jgi:hypothetical protein